MTNERLEAIRRRIDVVRSIPIGPEGATAADLLALDCEYLLARIKAAEGLAEAAKEVVDFNTDDGAGCTECIFGESHQSECAIGQLDAALQSWAATEGGE